MCVFFYNLQSQRTSYVTECKYSHAVFYPKMASAPSGTNTAGLKTYIWHKEILVPLPNHFLRLSEQGVKIFFRLVNVYFTPPACGLFSSTSDDIRARTGWLSADQTTTCEPERLPGHCPIRQLVNVIRRMWDVAALGRMKHVEGTFIPRRGIQREAELFLLVWDGCIS